MIEISVVKFVGKPVEHITSIRHAVFSIELKIDAKKDLDGEDPGAIHVLAKENEKYVGTGRLLRDGHIGILAGWRLLVVCPINFFT